MIQIWKLRRVANRGLKSITDLNTTTLDNHFMCCRDRLPSVARIASHSSFNKGRQRVVSSFKNARHQTGFAITSEGGQYYNGKMTEFVVLSCIVAATGGLIFGDDIGISIPDLVPGNGALKEWREKRRFTTKDRDLVSLPQRNVEILWQI
ncbi:hypothetical protein WN944_024672 [Citrus x changshan-huyou]|uniref:Uncharacterized protein n=1 Tax=Citrus x changshan-huyou TaxID=2935761 RepID=A0AAP0QCT9_9ROSI